MGLAGGFRHDVGGRLRRSEALCRFGVFGSCDFEYFGAGAEKKRAVSVFFGFGFETRRKRIESGCDRAHFPETERRDSCLDLVRRGGQSEHLINGRRQKSDGPTKS